MTGLNGAWLDAVWNFLVFEIPLATLLLGSMLLPVLLWRRLSRTALKRFWRAQSALLLIVTLAVLGLMMRPEPQRPWDCFANLVATKDSWMFTRLLALGWLVGFVGLCARDLIAAFWLIRRQHQICVPASAELTDEVHRLAREMRLTEPVRVWMTGERTSPFVFGWPRATLVIPHELPRVLDEKSRSAVWAHELAHVKDSDALWMWPQRLLQNLLFLHPLMPWFRTWSIRLVENAADRQALQVTGLKVGEFSAALLHVIEFCRAEGPSILVPGATRGFRELRDRLLTLEKAVREPVQIRPWHRLVLVTLVVGSGAWSYSQAMDSLGSQARANVLESPMQCYQIQHEIFLETLLRARKSEMNKCE